MSDTSVDKEDSRVSVQGTAPTVPGAMAIDGEASKRETKKGKDLSRFSGVRNPPAPSTLHGAVPTEGASTAHSKSGKGLSSRVSARSLTIPSDPLIANQSVSSTTGARRIDLSGASPETQQVPSITASESGARGLFTTSKNSTECHGEAINQKGPAKDSVDTKAKQVQPVFELPHKAPLDMSPDAKSTPTYMHYIVDEHESNKFGNDTVGQKQLQPSYTQYFADESDSRHFQNTEASAPPLRREVPVAAENRPGAYPVSFGRVDEDEWQQDGHLDAGVESGSLAPAIPNSSPSQNIEGLAVANPVSHLFSLDLDEAEYVDPELQKQRREEEKKKSKNLLAGMILVACLLVVGIVFALAFTIKRDSSNSDRQEEANQTLAPTSVEDLLLSLLPAQTVKAVNADGSSPQAIALAWLLEDPNLSAYDNWRKIQRFALATFFFATGGQLKNGEGKGKWLMKTNWLSYNHSECEWFASNHIGPSQPETVEFGLIDSYPPLLYESGLCSMNSLSSGKVERLVFFGNGLTGELPPEVFLLTELRGFASLANPVAGTIPSEIGLLSNLEFFALVAGGFQGSLPSELGNAQNLTHLICFRNQVSGSIPTQVGALKNLKGLVLDENKLDGTLPTELGLLSNAIWISSYSNHYTGKIPTQLGQLSSARFLGAWDNPFEGSLPSELGLLPSIQELNFQGNHLTGTLPTELGQMKTIEKIFLVTNNFSGQIPSELGLLQNLVYFSAGSSFITGTIPLELILAAKMRDLLMFHSGITGSIPTQIGLLSDLRVIAIQDTDITAQIPSQMGLLTSATHLSMFKTDITGPIPSQLGLLTMLKHLNLNDTPMSGDIPSELGAAPSLSFLGLRRIGDSDYSGFLPTEICALSVLIKIDCDELQWCPDDCHCDCTHD